MLQRVEPCLPSPAKAPPSGPDWLHEIKHDCYQVTEHGADDTDSIQRS
jgi:ATP-dependent DNA ligase